MNHTNGAGSKVNRKHDRLYEVSYDLLREADAELKALLTKGKMPTSSDDRARLLMSKLIGFHKEAIPQYSSVAMSVRMRLQQRSAYRKFLEFLGQLPEVEKHCKQPYGNGFESTTLNVSHLAQQMLTTYLERKGSFRPDSRAVRSIIKHVSKHYARNELSTKFKAYLENVELASKVISFRDGAKIRALSVADVVKEYNTSKYFRQFYNGAWRNYIDKRITAAIHVELTKPKKFGDACKRDPLAEEAVGESAVWMVLDALRIVAGGEINRSPIVVVTEFYPFENLPMPPGRNDFRKYTGMPRLEKKYNASLRRVYSHLRSAQKSIPVMSIVLKRLHYANNPRNSEDRILDICMGLEALVKGRLAKDTGIRTNSHIVGLYIADLVARTRKERQEKFRIIQDGYRVRNSVAHGSTPDRMDDEAVWEMFVLLRLSLYNVITRGHQFPKKSIDELIP